MKTRMLYILLATLQFMSWISVSNSFFAAHEDNPHHQGLMQESSQASWSSKPESKEGVVVVVVYENGVASMGLSRLGSRPPNCQYKCNGCSPCEATQIPATIDKVQYANYEPEGWKCKCGTAFFNP